MRILLMITREHGTASSFGSPASVADFRSGMLGGEAGSKKPSAKRKYFETISGTSWPFVPLILKYARAGEFRRWKAVDFRNVDVSVPNSNGTNKFIAIPESYTP
jgi:hypothetical protein